MYDERVRCIHAIYYNSALGERATSATWVLQGQRKRYRQEWFEALYVSPHHCHTITITIPYHMTAHVVLSMMWCDSTKNGLDGIITPVHAMPAVPHGSYGDMSFAACYTFIFNLLDLPAGTDGAYDPCASHHHIFFVGSLLSFMSSPCVSICYHI
jgi:hypothetical protein